MELLAKWMKANRFSDGDLAEEVGISRVQVLRLRQGKTGTTKANALRLQKITGIPWHEFIGPLTGASPEAETHAQGDDSFRCPNCGSALKVTAGREGKTQDFVSMLETPVLGRVPAGTGLHAPPSTAGIDHPVELITGKRAREITGILDPSTMYRRIQEGDFPKPVKLGRRSTRFVKAECEEYARKIVAKARGDSSFP